MLFVADVMLKKLARWLRILGVPTVFAGDYAEDDDEIIRLAMDRKAVLLTRDKAMARKARDYEPVVLLSSTAFEKQLLQLVREKWIPLSGFPSSTLCAHCGAGLRVVGRAGVRGNVYPRVLAAHDKFWVCENPKCKKIYWAGSHWKKIGGMVARVRKAARPASRAESGRRVAKKHLKQRKQS